MTCRPTSRPPLTALPVRNACMRPGMFLLTLLLRILCRTGLAFQAVAGRRINHLPLVFNRFHKHRPTPSNLPNKPNFRFRKNTLSRSLNHTNGNIRALGSSQNKPNSNPNQSQTNPWPPRCWVYPEFHAVHVLKLVAPP